MRSKKSATAKKHPDLYPSSLLIVPAQGAIVISICMAAFSSFPRKLSVTPQSLPFSQFSIFYLHAFSIKACLRILPYLLKVHSAEYEIRKVGRRQMAQRSQSILRECSRHEPAATHYLCVQKCKRGQRK